MIDFLEKHYIFFTRFVWIATYIVLLGVLDFYNVYKINDVPTFIYWLAKILTAMIVIGVAALLQINVDIELKSSFTINNKYIF